VSFELFNLGAEGTLVANNLTQVLPFLQKEGFKTYPSTCVRWCVCGCVRVRVRVRVTSVEADRVATV